MARDDNNKENARDDDNNKENFDLTNSWLGYTYVNGKLAVDAGKFGWKAFNGVANPAAWANMGGQFLQKFGNEEGRALGAKITLCTGRCKSVIST